MILKDLRLLHFGKFTQKEISLKPGLNVIYGKNEAGKSTMHSFIRGMLFGMERQRGYANNEDVYTRYLPWNSGGKYEGTLNFISGSKEYQIKRDFAKKKVTIFDLATGNEVPLNKGDISDVIPGVTDSLYRNTVSIGQLHTGTDVVLKKEVRNYITNLSASKTNEVDVSSALVFLNEKKKELQKKLDLLDTKHLSVEIKERMGQLSEVDELNDEMLRLESEEKRLREMKERFLHSEENIRKLNGDKELSYIRPKMEEYIALQKECEETKVKYNELTKSMNEILRVENCHKTIYRDIEEVNALHEQLHQLQTELAEIRHAEELMVRESRPGRRLFYLIPLILGLIIISILVPLIGISFCVAVAFLSIIYYVVKQARLHKNLQFLEQEEARIDHQCIDAEVRKRDIYLRNSVTGDVELRYKMQMLKDNQEELSQAQERRKAVELKQIQSYTKLEHLEKDISQFVTRYYKDYQIDEELIANLENDVKREKEQAVSDLDRITSEYKETLVRLEHMKWKLSNFAKYEEELQKTQKLYEEISENRSKIEKDLQAVLLASESINALSIDIQDSFGDQINERLSYIVEKVTNGRYKEVKMDENLNIRVLRDHDYISFEKLSAGAIAEIYLALRITVADMLNGTKNLPLILDEAFVLYDDSRLEATLRELSNIADRQIIIFTCHKRELEILDRCEIDYHSVILS